MVCRTKSVSLNLHFVNIERPTQNYLWRRSAMQAGESRVTQNAHEETNVMRLLFCEKCCRPWSEHDSWTWPRVLGVRGRPGNQANVANWEEKRTILRNFCSINLEKILGGPLTNGEGSRHLVKSSFTSWTSWKVTKDDERIGWVKVI
jgi:hypothetical protein